MKEQNIHKMLANGERATLECKKAQTCVPNSLGETYSAFAMNTYLMLNGILKVEKYDDRFVLTNPGLLKLPVEQIYAGGESKARNQRMQAMLRMIGYGEKLGSGFPLILSAWNEKHWLKPELIEQPDLMQVKLILHIEDKEKKSLVTHDETKDVLKNVQKDVLKELSERQLIILNLIKENVHIKIEDMSRMLRVNEKIIRRDLSNLQEKEIIIREGGRKNGHWIIKQYSI